MNSFQKGSLIVHTYENLALVDGETNFFVGLSQKFVTGCVKVSPPPSPLEKKLRQKEG